MPTAISMPMSGMSKGRDNKLKKFWIPILIFICFAGLYYSIALFSDENAFFSPVWDIRHYVNISETGYEVHPCTPTDYPPGEVCGNVGWYPGWPIIMKIIRPLLGGSSKATYIALSALLTLAGFIFLFRFAEKTWNRTVAICAVVSLAGSPAGFYLLTGFPYAFFLFLFTLYIHFFYSKGDYIRHIILSILAFAITLTYPTGLLFSIIPLVSLIEAHVKSRSLALNFKYDGRTIVLGILPFFLGLVMLWLFFYFRFDNFFVQLDFQARYQRTWSFPLTVIFNSLKNYPLASPENLVFIWYGLALIVFAPYKTRIELWVLGIVLFLFSPATGTTLSIYRHFLVIFPVYLIIGASPRSLWLKVFFTALGLAFSLIWIFPIYLNFRLI